MIELDAGLVTWMTDLRRWFHQHPEPSFEERGTQDKIVDVLGQLGIDCRRAGQTGVVADIRGNGPRRTIALRSDMDALRIQEADTDLNREYRSRNDGVMHACGHDAHMAMLLGAARWLLEHWDSLEGNVRLIFQPAEEVPPGGAGLMIADGCLDGVDAIAAVHVFGNMPLSRIGFRSGPFMAATRTFKVTIEGRPGHHMCPQDTIDPIQIAARFISTIQTDVRHRLNPNARYVLGFGEIHAGTQHNQTPATAEVVGTFRAYDTRDSETIVAAIRSNLDGLMQTFSVGQDRGAPSDSATVPRYILEAEPAYPPLVNSPAFTRRTAEVLRQSFVNVDDDMEPNLGGEDFACYLEQVPGVFLFLGGGNPERGITAMNHSDRFDMDESVLVTGTKVLVTLATDFLRDPGPYLGRLA